MVPEERCQERQLWGNEGVDTRFRIIEDDVSSPHAEALKMSMSRTAANLSLVLVDFQTSHFCRGRASEDDGDGQKAYCSRHR